MTYKLFTNLYNRKLTWKSGLSTDFARSNVRAISSKPHFLRLTLNIQCSVYMIIIYGKPQDYFAVKRISS